MKKQQKSFFVIDWEDFSYFAEELWSKQEKRDMEPTKFCVVDALGNIAFRACSNLDEDKITSLLDSLKIKFEKKDL